MNIYIIFYILHKMKNNYIRSIETIYFRFFIDTIFIESFRPLTLNLSPRFICFNIVLWILFVYWIARFCVYRCHLFSLLFYFYFYYIDLVKRIYQIRKELVCSYEKHIQTIQNKALRLALNKLILLFNKILKQTDSRTDSI